MSRVILIVVALLSVASEPLASLEAAERIYVTVVDAKGKPVTGLTASDFIIELDGARQEIVSASVAVEPISLVILTDRLGLSSSYTAFDVGQALKEFVAVIRAGSPESKIALTTFDGTVLQLTKFTSAPGELDRALGRLSTTATDALFLEGLADVCKLMRTAPTDRRIIFTLIAAYRPDQSSLRNEMAAEMLRLSKASLWTVEARQNDRGDFANNVREVVLDAGGQLSGGTREIVNSRTGVGVSSKQMAELMLSQYLLTYGPAGGKDTSRLRIAVNRPGARVLAPRWTSR